MWSDVVHFQSIVVSLVSIFEFVEAAFLVDLGYLKWSSPLSFQLSHTSLSDYIQVYQYFLPHFVLIFLFYLLVVISFLSFLCSLHVVSGQFVHFWYVQ